MIINPKDIDFSKYKRFFAFGCSFTNWRWPTWADLLRSQMPNAEYYNAGRGGAGNLYISTQYSLYDKKYKFNEDDLVVILWSTYCREDRYVKNSWLTAGNMLTQNIYDDEYVQNYVDIKGYMIRDLAIIDNLTKALKSSKHDNIQLLSVPVMYDADDKNITDDLSPLLNMYKDLIEELPVSFFENENNQWKHGHTYYHSGFDDGPAKSIDEPHEPNYADYHPNTIAHYNYLKTLGFPLNQSAESYARETTALSNTFTHQSQFQWDISEEIL